jgi:hypothetical protein
LDGIGGVGVIAHCAAVTPDLRFQTIAAFPYPAQLRGDALACLIGKPRGLDFFAHLRRPFGAQPRVRGALSLSGCYSSLFIRRKSDLWFR